MQPSHHYTVLTADSKSKRLIQSPASFFFYYRLQSTLGIWFPLSGHYQMTSRDALFSPNLLLKRSSFAYERIMSLVLFPPLLETIAL